jgi:RNA polymerase sigma factor (sigma-70 family)
MLATFTHSVVHAVPTSQIWPALGPEKGTAGNHHRDYTHTPDVLLVVFAVKTNNWQAVRELIRRHYGWMRTVVAWHGRRARPPLRGQDLQDAQQDALFALPEAICAYDLLESCRPDGRSFPRFLRQVVVRRFRDGLRRLRLLESKCRGQYGLEEALEQGAPCPLGEPGGRDSLDPDAQDPALTAEYRDLRERLPQAVARLSPEQRLFLEQWAEGTPVEALARACGISRRTAYRRIQAILAELRRQFEDALE